MGAVDPIRITPNVQPINLRPHEGSRMGDHPHEKHQRTDTYEFHDGSEAEPSEELTEETTPQEESAPLHLDIAC